MEFIVGQVSRLNCMDSVKGVVVVEMEGRKKMKKTIARLWKWTIVSVFFEWCRLRIRKEMRLTS